MHLPENLKESPSLSVTFLSQAIYDCVSAKPAFFDEHFNSVVAGNLGAASCKLCFLLWFESKLVMELATVRHVFQSDQV